LNRTSTARTVAGAVGLALAVAAASFGASSYQGCALYSSSLIGSAITGDDAGSNAATCAETHAVPPSRPAADDGGDGPDIPAVVAALRTIDIGVSDIDAAIPPFGFDLDNDCTCPGPPSCAPSKIAPPGDAGITCDDEAGRDNTDIQLFRLLQGPASTGTAQINQGLTAGQYGLLFVITNYNGTANDSSVNVDFYVSNGLNRSPDGGIPTPLFNGNDFWTIDPNSLTGGQPVFSADGAYVSNNVLVAKLAQLPVVFGDRSFLGGATMQLSDAVVVGQLQLVSVVDGDGGTLRLALTGGTIAGRWPTSKMLGTLATIPAGGGFLCGTDPSKKNQFDYQTFKGVICGNADISQLQGNDNQTPLAPCDAISVGMQFTATPAQLGAMLAVPAAPAGCGDADNPWSDNCSQ
jgi:hypothetical protein